MKFPNSKKYASYLFLLKYDKRLENHFNMKNDTIYVLLNELVLYQSSEICEVFKTLLRNKSNSNGFKDIPIISSYVLWALLKYTVSFTHFFIFLNKQWNYFHLWELYLLYISKIAKKLTLICITTLSELKDCIWFSSFIRSPKEWERTAEILVCGFFL